MLGPYVSELLRRQRVRRRVAVLLYDCESADKAAQSLLEMVRGGIGDQAVDVTAFVDVGTAGLDRQFVATLPFDVRDWDSATGARALLDGGFEYVALFESSGMYDGEDVPWLISHLTGRLDAVWGSRRLSVRDIEESLRLKYRKRAHLALLSSIGSHTLSLLYLALYGRYVSDTLSGARAVRVADAASLAVGLTDRRCNQYLLSRLLGRKAEMFEVPVHFYSLSPALVHRTTTGEGLRAIGTILWQRIHPSRSRADRSAALDHESAKA